MMKSVELKKTLVSKLLSSCIEQLEYMKSELLGQTVFAYAVFCGSGCSSMSMAACTREGLMKQPVFAHKEKKPEWYNEIQAAEWNYFNKHYKLFENVNAYIGELFDIFYDGEIDNGELDEYNDDELWAFISEFFVDASVQVLGIMKSNGHLSGDLFEKDLLLGMQFGDPDGYSIDMIERSSKRLNSSVWHTKVKFSCDSKRKNI